LVTKTLPAQILQSKTWEGKAEAQPLAFCYNYANLKTEPLIQYYQFLTRKEVKEVAKVKRTQRAEITKTMKRGLRAPSAPSVDVDRGFSQIAIDQKTSVSFIDSRVELNSDIGKIWVV